MTRYQIELLQKTGKKQVKTRVYMENAEIEKFNFLKNCKVIAKQ